MKITDVDINSPLYDTVKPGFSLVAINGETVADEIDFRFKTASELLQLEFTDQDGKRLDIELADNYGMDLGLTFEEGKVLTCRCKCVFCFVRQQPSGMRPALYIKDEDYRLSFTHGHYVTLSNVSADDLKRIIEQRLSPLYVSVHATDDDLRRRLLGNQKLLPVLPQLKHLTANGIELHTQVVLCPELNDGEHLKRTITDLAELHPQVRTLAIVPVGLTKFREGQVALRQYSPEESAALVRQIEQFQKQFQQTLGSRFVWPADELYLRAGRKLPSLSSYEEMEQFENGVGMVREFLTNFNRRRARLKGTKSSRKALFLTGASAGPILAQEVMPYIAETLKLKAKLQVVENRFWGDSVTVSGLLTGQDLLRRARAAGDDCDIVVLPPNCLNTDNLFLDNLALNEFRRLLNKPVVVGRYDLAETIREIFV